MTKLTWEFPLETVSEANSHEFWRVKHERHKKQKKIVYMCLKSRIKGVTLPCHIKLTRIATRMLDPFDNLPSSLKYIADACCELLLPGLAAGRADGDPRITLSCSQEKAVDGINKVRIEMECI